uniref:Alpha-beta-hydrolase n=1 Tax=Ophiocordycipitaceae sp. TaxID=1907519 RepID=A0A6M8PB86_9HYPO|nr:alpha-beta-hydrolase [Ophiocordycipitaceae sp.]QKG63778.1 alpha-beta-hydrolase [Ophiocordycipitaceae sp.]
MRHPFVGSFSQPSFFAWFFWSGHSQLFCLYPRGRLSGLPILGFCISAPRKFHFSVILFITVLSSFRSSPHLVLRISFILDFMEWASCRAIKTKKSSAYLINFNLRKLGSKGSDLLTFRISANIPALLFKSKLLPFRACNFAYTGFFLRFDTLSNLSLSSVMNLSGLTITK